MRYAATLLLLLVLIGCGQAHPQPFLDDPDKVFVCQPECTCEWEGGPQGTLVHIRCRGVRETTAPDTVSALDPGHILDLSELHGELAGVNVQCYRDLQEVVRLALKHIEKALFGLSAQLWSDQEEQEYIRLQAIAARCAPEKGE